MQHNTDKLKEMNENLRQTHKVQHEYSSIEGEALRAAQFTRPGGLWHRFFMWVARQAAIGRAECAEVRREIEAEINEERGRL